MQQVCSVQRVLALDFGDAPNSYDGAGATVATAYHAIEADGPYLGAIAPDVEDAAASGLPPWASDNAKRGSFTPVTMSAPWFAATQRKLGVSTASWLAPIQPVTAASRP